MDKTINVVDPSNPSAKMSIHNPLHSYQMQGDPVLTAPPNR